MVVIEELVGVVAEVGNVEGRKGAMMKGGGVAIPQIPQQTLHNGDGKTGNKVRAKWPRAQRNRRKIIPNETI